MAEIKCPMCGKANPEGADTCAHCGARLTPVTGGLPYEPPPEQRPEEPMPPEPVTPAPPPDAAGDELAEGEVPEWLQRIRAKQAAEEAEAGEGGDEFGALRAGFSDEPDDSGAGGDREPDESEPEPPMDQAAALDEAMAARLRAEAPPGDFAAAQPAAPEPAAEQPMRMEPAAEEPMRMEPAAEEPMRMEPAAQEPTEKEPGEPEPAAAEPPAQPPSEGAETGLPHVPALVGQQPGPLDADELGLPDWLGEIEPLEDDSAAGESGGTGAAGRLGPDIERATLPNWLEAMRPVDTFRSVVQIDPEDDQAVESVGPLAGLRGVLLAEPVVAMPRSSTTGAMQLEVSERQYAQAELLHRMISEEESSQPAVPKRSRRLPFFRWAIAAVTVLAAAMPILTGAPGFALPSLEPKELGPLFDLVGGLPTDRPALFVFDYEPGYSGELDAVSGALLDQVMARGLPVASISTRPTGSPLAERVMEPFALRHGYVAGSDLVHLGYLSGGPAAVQLFALDPRGAILKGFALPESMVEAGQGAWDSPALQNVSSLSDFGVVAVITAGSETARVWVEQAEPSMGGTPLLMVLSAGVEPLVRPYYEANQPQIDGILTGLPAAVAYEQRNGRFGSAFDRWNAFGAGMLAAEVVLVAGAGYGLLRWVMRRGED